MLPTIIAKNLSFEQISQIEERKLEFNAFDYRPFNERIYQSSFGHFHLLGYLREVDRDTIPSLDKSLLYRAGELIGWQGVEKQYERELRYSKGVSYLEVDTYGREVFELEDGNIIAQVPIHIRTPLLPIPEYSGDAILSIADEIIVLENGSIVYSGKAKEIQKDTSKLHSLIGGQFRKLELEISLTPTAFISFKEFSSDPSKSIALQASSITKT